MARIAVVGGAGFIGTNLCRKLVELGYDVIAIDDFSTGLESNLQNVECEIFRASISNYSSMEQALQGSEYIFHLAARGSVPRSLLSPRATLEVNVMGTLNVLECARKFGATVAFSSSSSVYGANPLLPKIEKSWTGPLSPYAASKLAGEALIHSYAASFKIPAITYRFFNVFGPWQRPDHAYAAVIPKWIWKLLRGENTIEVYGDGEQSRDFTDVNSVVSILIEGMVRKINHPLPINLAFGESITLNEVIMKLKLHFPNFKVMYSQERTSDVRDSMNDPTYLFELFPNVEKPNFEIALSRTLAWYIEHGHAISNGPIDMS